MRTIAWGAAIACLALYALAGGRYAAAIEQSHARAQRAYAAALGDEAQVRQAAGIARARTEALRGLRSSNRQDRKSMAVAQFVRAFQTLAAKAGCRIESIAPEQSVEATRDRGPIVAVAQFDVQLRGHFDGIVHVSRALPHAQTLLEVTHLHIERTPGAVWTRTPVLEAGFAVTLYRLRLPQ